MPQAKFTGPAVLVDNVSFNYEKLKALDGLSLEVPAGISFGLLGPNGAGKTTLIRLLVGLLRPKSGTVKVLGSTPSRRMSHLIGYMPQLHSIYTELTVRQNVDFFARVYLMNNKQERNKQVDETIKLVNLWERRDDSVLKLSGGMRQRVSLACAIVHNPPILFLDEPTVGLDPELRVSFWDHFTDLTARGVTIIISSHTMDDAAHCNQLAFIRDGRVIAQGSPIELQLAVGKPLCSLEDAFLYFIHRGESPND